MILLDEGIDISDLLKVDDRIAASWRSAEVENGILYLSLPIPNYEIERTRIEGDTMLIDLYVEKTVLQQVKHYEFQVPLGVEKIVYGKILK